MKRRKNVGRKYVFFDVDGTLVSHVGESHIPHETVEAILRLREKGHVPAIATARSLCLTRKVASSLGMELLVCCNGAHVLYKDRILEERYLPSSFVEAMKHAAFERHFDISLLDAEHVYTGQDSPDFAAYLREQAGFDCRSPLACASRAFLAYNFSKTSFHTEDAEGVEFFPSPHYVEARLHGVSKWSGILKSAAALGFEIQDIVAVGDGANDVDMIEKASIGIAIKGSVAERSASYVAEDIDRGGIFDILKKLDMI